MTATTSPSSEKPKTRDLDAPRRRALAALTRTRTLLGRRGQFRENWSDKNETPIADKTITALESGGYVYIGKSPRLPGFKTARLTRAGEYLAETMCGVSP